MSRRLWLVRHARPLVAQGICYGALNMAADAAATQATAQRLAATLPTRVQVRHSPLQRCELLVLTLQALRPDLDITPDARLREMDFGAWEGQTWDAIGQAAVDAWMEGFATHAPGGGESLGAMLQRVAEALHEAHATPAADVVWITHAGVARCVDWLQTQGSTPPRADAWPLAAPGYGEWEVRPLGA